VFSPGRFLPGAVALVAAVAVLVPASLASGKAASVSVYPSSTSIRATGTPAGGAKSITLDTALGEQEDAIVLVSGASQVAVAAPATIGPLPVKLFFGHYVSFDGTPVPDALLPWEGDARPTEQPNQPLWVQVTVPYGTPAGTYSGAISVVADGATSTVTVNVRVTGVSIPPPGQATGNLLTAFHVSAQTYVNTVSSLFRLALSDQRHPVNPTLYRFLASYRISPNSWGFGEPRSPSGYTSDHAWFRSPAANMQEEVGSGSFAAMAVPLSNNRTSPRNYIAGLSPLRPETWCGYLQSVRSFWDSHGWASSLPYLYGLDETDGAGFKVVARQARTLHSCFPGAKELTTGNPSSANEFLWDGGSNDVDIWAVLANRYYGKYTVPLESRKGISHEHDHLSDIDKARSRGKQIWLYNYRNTKTPSFTATEPLSDSRMVFLWAALEGITGVLYGEGTTNYQGDPYQAVAKSGEFVLLYPGLSSPVPSARLEQIRDGIEDWDIYNLLRERRGAAAVRRILGGAGLFSATAAKVEVGCTIGCDLKSATPFAWPSFSQDGSTPGRIEKAKLQALLALGG
jgi:hypothetical protein